MANANRKRGDYLERQTKAALEAHGWFVVRAAGSLGAADLVALKGEFRPLLIACKTNGTVPPHERVALRKVAELADATPLCASRPKRGTIELRLVLTGPQAPLVDSLKAPVKGKRDEEL